MQQFFVARRLRLLNAPFHCRVKRPSLDSIRELVFRVRSFLRAIFYFDKKKGSFIFSHCRRPTYIYEYVCVCVCVCVCVNECM